MSQGNFRNQNRDAAKTQRQLLEEQYAAQTALPEKQNSSKLPLVIVYEDDRYLSEIKKQLAALRRTMEITIEDRRLTADAVTYIREKAQHQKVAVMILIDSDFLAEDVDIDFLKKLADLVHSGIVRIIPVRVRPCSLADSAYAVLQYVPDKKPVSEYSNVDKALLEVTQGTKLVLSQMLAPLSGE